MNKIMKIIVEINPITNHILYLFSFLSRKNNKDEIRNTILQICPKIHRIFIS